MKKQSSALPRCGIPGQSAAFVYKNGSLGGGSISKVFDTISIAYPIYISGVFLQIPFRVFLPAFHYLKKFLLPGKLLSWQQGASNYDAVPFALIPISSAEAGQGAQAMGRLMARVR